MKVLVVSVHPDDEILGAGGTLLMHSKKNDDILWLIITNIQSDQGYTEDQINKRQNEIDTIAEKLKVSEVINLNYPTTTLTDITHNKMIPRITNIFMEFKPEIIYSVNRSDAHSDHRITANAIFACTKSFRFPFIKRVLMYECISETELAVPLPENIFIPNYFMDISDFLTKKLELLRVYESEIGAHPFPRSLENVEALAKFRGSIAGVKYAEAFQVVKIIEK